MSFSLCPLMTLLVVLAQFTEECDAKKTMQQWLDHYKADDHIINKKNFAALVSDGAFISRGEGCYDVNDRVLNELIRQNPKQQKPPLKPMVVGGLHWSKMPAAPHSFPDPDPARAARGYKVVIGSDWKRYKKEVARREEYDAKLKWQDWKRKNNKSCREQSQRAREKRQKKDEEQRVAAIEARKMARKKRFTEMLRETKTSVVKAVKEDRSGLASAAATGSALEDSEAATSVVKEVGPGLVSAPATESAPADSEAATSVVKNVTKEEPGLESATATGSAPARSLEADVIRGYNAARHYDDARWIRDLDDEWRINHFDGIEVA